MEWYNQHNKMGRVGGVLGGYGGGDNQKGGDGILSLSPSLFICCGVIGDDDRIRIPGGGGGGGGG